MKRFAAAFVVLGCAGLLAQAPTQTLGSSTGIPGLITTTLVFNAADANKDGVLTREELEAAVAKWFATADSANAGAVTRDQLLPALNTALPMQSLAAMMAPAGRGGQPQTPEPNTAAAMMAALPSSAPAKPAHPRKVLVLGRAAGFVHSSIPLAAKTIDALGTKTGAWSTTITFDAADINPENLKQYDAVFLASTTGAFLDDPKDPSATSARRQALLEFVRGGKGLAGIHAATDSYHQNVPAPGDAGRGGRGAGGANPFANVTPGATLADMMIAQGDRNKDGKLDKAESKALADAWFDAIDTRKTGKLLQSDFALFALLIPNPADAAVPQGPDTQVGTWQDFNTLIGGYFKFHWLDPQLITVKIDDPKSPLTAMFHGQEFDVRDEIYTMGIQSFSRDNVRVLTSIDYGKMSAADKALEVNPRADHDFGLSWVHREGQGRVFYEALGHSERIYANKAILEHLLAGVQYALGDLKADDSPSKK
ncbi:MAG TPA: ThuA domain-containing protein [Vicinamibacterales bacterium]|nr:ThuA domain-containing protein [Vicinamibacterales bacterium]